MNIGYFRHFLKKWVYVWSFIYVYLITKGWILYFKGIGIPIYRFFFDTMDESVVQVKYNLQTLIFASFNLLPLTTPSLCAYDKTESEFQWPWDH